ncbi:MAG: FAD-binding oxidoreductase [Leptolyngbya sp. SIO1E4]|nr:FAD-binding oxidoreductase [Leptolyngbya sp. SIO1E4]
MQTFDWIVIGNGLTGAALSYELSRQGCSVLLLDKALDPASATRYSYGGIPYWSGSTDLLRQLCQQGWSRHQSLFEETGVSTQLRELDLLLTIAPDQDAKALAERYAAVEIPPVLISAQEVAEREPQLNAAAISGALTVRHGHVEPMALVKAYNHGLQNAGGRVVIAPVTGLVRMGDRITGVTTPTQAYAASNVAIAAGGHTRDLLKTAGIQVPVYFTHAEIIETPPLETSFRALVMPADLSRSGLESEASQAEVDALWDAASHEIVPPILDAGFIQFLDNTVRIGQISRIETSLHPQIDAQASERQLRQGIAPLIPALADAPGQWRACQVAFSRDGLPLAGPIPGLTGVAVFSGFNSPFALVPGAAVEFARWATGQASSIMESLRPERFVISGQKS